MSGAGHREVRPAGDLVPEQPPERAPPVGAGPREPSTALVAAPDSWGPLTKDFLVFEAKLLLDGLIDVVMAPVAAAAYFLDLVLGDRTGRRFYPLLRVGRRLESWLRLYRPSSRAGAPKETLAEAGLTSADQLLAKIEGMIKEQELPEVYRERLRELTDRARAKLPEGPTRARVAHTRDREETD